MRKITLLPAVALSLMTFGVIAEAVPASAAPSAIVTGEDNGDQNAPPPTFSGTLSSSGGVSSNSGGGSGSATPSGGAFTGAGGTAVDDASNVAPFLAAGGAGLGLLALSAAMRRRRTAEV